MKLKILEIGDACTGCGACANICPKRCLELKQNIEGFYYPVFNDLSCIECGLCEKACHAIAEKIHKSPDPNNFFLYHSNDKKLLEYSSSGGGFSLFADWILRQGGVVYGSRYNGKEQRLEVFNTDQIELAYLRKSKYIESYTGKAFSEIKNHLKKGRRVLYCGTPCQVRGLKQYLSVANIATDLLLTIDFACHGVPSNKIFNLFKSRFERKNHVVNDVDFRYKDFSKPYMMWHKMTLRLGFSDNFEKTIQMASYNFFFYYQLFLDNLVLRKSCYKCDIALHSDADITLGDFWGIYKHRKELDDNKGMSFVCINNSKFFPIWEELSKIGFSEKLPYEAIKYQYKDNRLIRAKQLIRRNDFVKQVCEVGYDKAVINHYGRFQIYKCAIKFLIKQIIGKV